MAQATDWSTTNFTWVDSTTGFKVNGTTVIDANGNSIAANTETIAAGWTTTAADLTKMVHDVDADAGGDIVTLADGTAGQIMIFVMKSATWTLTLTPATFLWGTSVTFNAAGDTVMLIFQDTLGWSVIGGNSYAVI